MLGPLLFLVYINDLPENIKSQIRIFADDTYIYRKILNPEDVNALQKDLNDLEKWEKSWSMEFHPDKCKVLRISNKIKPVIGAYKLHDKVLENVDQAKYLGVTIQKKLSWKPHIQNITKKANQTIGFLQRNLRFCNSSTKAMCFKVYVRPIVNYAAPVWNPVGQQNMGLRNSLEMVQRRGARFVFNQWERDKSPTKMLVDLKWNTLESDRKKLNLILMHKIIHQKVAISTEILPNRTRYCDLKFQPVYGRVNAFKNSFLPTTTKWWNELPSSSLFEDNIDKFKLKLDNN